MPWPKLMRSRSASRAASVISRAARWPAFIFDVSISVPGSSGLGAVFSVSFTVGIINLLKLKPNDEIRRSDLVKRFLLRGQALQEREGRKPRLASGQPLHFRDHLFQAQGLGVTQRPAPERRETGAHDHPEIHIGGIGHDLLFETTRSFVD